MDSIELDNDVGRPLAAGGSRADEGNWRDMRGGGGGGEQSERPRLQLKPRSKPVDGEGRADEAVDRSKTRRKHGRSMVSEPYKMEAKMTENLRFRGLWSQRSASFGVLRSRRRRRGSPH